MLKACYGDIPNKTPNFFQWRKEPEENSEQGESLSAVAGEYYRSFSDRQSLL